MERLLKDIIDEKSRARRQSDIVKESPAQVKRVPVQHLRLVRDGSIKYEPIAAPVSSPQHCVGIFREHFSGAPGEMVSVLSLNAQNKYLAVTPVAWGTLTEVHVTRRQIFTPLLAKHNAAAFILAHNHPSGNPTPSPEDLALFELVRDEGEHLDCPLLDFIIIGDGTMEYYSHREAKPDDFKDF